MTRLLVHNDLRQDIAQLIAVYDVAAGMSGRVQIDRHLRRACRILANGLMGGADHAFLDTTAVRLVQTDAPEPEQLRGWRRWFRWVRRAR
ncbi:MAG: hypothetical protein ACE147_00790 [Candidatus Methylomirabilales bacterium]